MAILVFGIGIGNADKDINYVIHIGNTKNVGR